jgi:VIT1/CCC1 family predicted Fe2+/Mn2+ transporter
MTDYVKRLTRLARVYAAAEEAIVSAFFAKRHKKSDHLRWLRAQAFKEYSAIKPIFTALAKLYPELDRQMDRQQFEELTEKLADETKHARLVMDLLEELTGKRVTFADLLWLPEDRRLATIRARYSKSLATLLHGNGTIKAKEIRRQDEELERAAITLTEGGGGALYRVCSRLKTNGFEGKIARAFKEILLDEVAHKDSGIRSLAACVRNDTAFRRAARIISEVSSQRLRMRNEQFDFPLSERELMILDQRARVSTTNKPRAAEPQAKSKEIYRKERKGRKKM